VNELNGKGGKVSIIILNYNGKNLLRNCLGSIKNKTLYKNYEIIIVDNNSKDGSIKMVQKNFPKVEIIKNPKNYGFSKGNNIGMKRALKGGTDYVLILNNDTEATENWLNEMVGIIESNEKIGMVGPRLILPNGEIQKNCYNFRFGLIIKFAPDKLQEVDYITAACMLIKKRVIEEVGFFDEEFSPIYYEDADLCLRTKKAGYKIVYVPGSKVFHHKGITMRKQEWQFRAINTNRLKFFFKHFSIPWLILRLLIEPWNILNALKEGKLKILFSIYFKFLRFGKYSI